MTNIQSLFSRALLAAALLSGAGIASAGAIYHVDINTATLADAGNGTGYLDLFFIPFGTADLLTATVTNLHGDFVGMPTSTNVTAGADGSLTFLSDLSTDFQQQVTLGKTVSFDISFSGLPSGLGTAGFGADFINADYSAYLSNAVLFTLRSDGASYATDPGVASVLESADVPEPSTLLGLFTGIGLMGLSLRRRA
jgi:hypothetical protein